MEIIIRKLKLSKVLEKLWTYLTVDFITKLLVVARKDVILVVYNRLSKIMYFITTTEEILTEELVWLFRDNVQKLYGLLESIVSDRGLQFVTEIIKELNKMLGIKTKLLILFYPQTNSQTERKNQELEQYLRFFVNYRQKNQLEQLVLVEFIINNKTYSITKVFLFIANYSRELRMRIILRRKRKIKKTIEFVERMRKI